MFTVIEGKISSSEGLREALEIVLTAKTIQNGMLRIAAEEVDGRIGIFCGRYITGAVLSQTGETGYPAVRKLLSAKTGNFVFLDAKGESLSELKQSLALDISSLLEALPDFLMDKSPWLSDEWLSGLPTADQGVFQNDISYEDDLPDLNHSYGDSLSDCAEQAAPAVLGNEPDARPTFEVVPHQDFELTPNVAKSLTHENGREGLRKNAFNKLKTWRMKTIGWVTLLFWVFCFIVSCSLTINYGSQFIPYLNKVLRLLH